VAELSLTQARHLASALEGAGVGERRFAGAYFNEVAIQVPDANRRHAELLEQGIVAGLPLGKQYPELSDTLLLATTELTRDADIERLVAALEATR
jgi:glycine dehydrogenase subunit 1